MNFREFVQLMNSFVQLCGDDMIRNASIPSNIHHIALPRKEDLILPKDQKENTSWSSWGSFFCLLRVLLR